MITNFLDSIRAFGAGVYDFLMEIGYPFTLTLAQLMNPATAEAVYTYTNPISGARDGVVLRAVQEAVSWLMTNVLFIPEDTVFFVAVLICIAYGFFAFLVVKLIAWAVTSLT